MRHLITLVCLCFSFFLSAQQNGIHLNNQPITQDTIYLETDSSTFELGKNTHLQFFFDQNTIENISFIRRILDITINSDEDGYSALDKLKLQIGPNPNVNLCMLMDFDPDYNCFESIIESISSGAEFTNSIEPHNEGISGHVVTQVLMTNAANGDIIDSIYVKYEWSPTTNVTSNELNISKIELFPNPSQNQITLNSPSGIKNVTILNLNGAVVKNIFGESQSSILVNLTSYLPGIYLFQIELETGDFEQIKVIKK